MDYIGPVSSAVMALVWVVYFQLFFLQYRRNNRPYLVIHHAQSESPDASCLLVNMGKEPVHLQCVQALVRNRSGREKLLTVTDYQRVNADERNFQQMIRQGPIQPGGYLLLGSFRDIIHGRQSDEDAGEFCLEEVEGLELRAAMVHGPSKFPIGVRRRFFLHQRDGSQVFPQNIYTEQLVRRRDRHKVRAWLEQELNPKSVGRSESDRSEQSSGRD